MAAMTFTARGEWTETVVSCDACGEEMSFCNKDLCGGEYPPDYEFYESAALKMAAENHLACKEDSDGDSVLDSTEPDRPVAGPRTVEDVAGRLAVLGQRLVSEGESMQRQIAAIRQTIADYHAEMRRIQEAEP